jgi:outer membrane receptor protein involved in Fe transport
MSPDQLSIVQSFYASGTAQYNYIAADGEVTVTQPLNGPGGVLEGIEVTYQQNLDFIPAFMGGEGFGVNANYTKIRSVQHYIVNSTVSAGVTTNVLADGPWNGASPDAWNMTVYYDGSNWEARVSGAFRSGYLYLYPVAGGSDQLGMGNAPLVNDFGYSRNTLNLDFSASYDIDENIALTLDALNITNQPDRRWAYENTPQTTRYQSSGRQLFVGFRMKY